MDAGAPGLPAVSVWLSTILLCSGLVTAGLYDLLYRRIPNSLTMTLLFAGLALQGLDRGAEGLGRSLLGALVGGGLLFVPFALRLLGGGDVKLLAAIGAWLGPLSVLLAAGVGCVLGGLLVLGLLVGRPNLRREVGRNLLSGLLTRRLPRVGRRPGSDMVPVGTALAAGGMLTYMLGWGS